MKFSQLLESIEDFQNHIKEKYDLTSFFIHEKDDVITLSMIEVPREERKQGVGTAVMNELVAYADANKKRIYLMPGIKDTRHGTTSKSRLIKFYKRFGFIENKGKKRDFSLPPGMVREPR